MTQDPLSSIIATSEQMLEGGWELIVGLEVHVELATKTKLFSGSPNHFGDEPNTNIDSHTRLAWCVTCSKQTSGRTRYAHWCCSELQHSALHIPPQELLLSRHAKGVPN